MSNNDLHPAVKTILIVAVVALIFSLSTAFIYFLWNWTVVEAFSSAPTITFVQAFIGVMGMTFLKNIFSGDK